MGSSLGTGASGRIIQALQTREGWTEVDAYHTLFWAYTAMGILNVLLVLPLSDACELNITQQSYMQVAQVESEHHQQERSTIEPAPLPIQQEPLEKSPRTFLTKTKNWFSTSLSQISAPTRSVMYKLWFLLAVDALADGMVPYALTNYYMDIKFHPSKSTLGDVTSVSYLLGAISAVFAGPLAKKIGLINTMVFTHVPSSTAVLLFPVPSVFWGTAALLFVRAGLNNMDQAPRTAFIAAVVKSEERTAVMGITSMLRTLAALGGPTVTGILAAGDRFWVAFVVAGICRLAYDFGLWAMFVDMKLYQHESQPEDVGRRRERDEEETLEMESLVGSESSEEENKMEKVISKEENAKGGLSVPVMGERLRSRSPHRRTPTNS